MFGNLFGPISSTSAVSSGLSLSKILGGAGKTLGFINKTLPLYYQVKPMLNNAKTVLNMYTAMGDSKQEEIKTISKPKEIQKPMQHQIEQPIKTKHYKYNNDTLTFFQ